MKWALLLTSGLLASGAVAQDFSKIPPNYGARDGWFIMLEQDQVYGGPYFHEQHCLARLLYFQHTLPETRLSKESLQSAQCAYRSNTERPRQLRALGLSEDVSESMRLQTLKSQGVYPNL